jgi:predicted transcriptional regulator
MKSYSIILFLLIVFIANVSPVHAGYTIDPSPLRNGTIDSLGADTTVSFSELPLWVQLAWIISSLVAIFGAIKLGPVVIGKVREILQNKNQAVILEYIRRNPGCTLSGLSKKTGINPGTIKYHLYILILERKIVRERDGKLSYLFVNGDIPPEKRQVYGHIMNPAKREILDIILNRPGISNKEIAHQLQLDPSTVYWHLQQFLGDKMIASHWDGRSRNYTLLPEVEEILKECQK